MDNVENTKIEKAVLLKPGELITIASLLVVALDQFTKMLILEILGFHEDKVIIDGFFKLVYWGNTGAAWSLFRDNNELLTVISLIALLLFFISRDKFDTKTRPGQIAMGLIFGGIIGNIVDRLFRGHVVDFLYFYIIRRSGNEIGFPAFNVADIAICTGVGILLILTLSKNENQTSTDNPAQSNLSNDKNITNHTHINPISAVSQNYQQKPRFSDNNIAEKNTEQ